MLIATRTDVYKQNGGNMDPDHRLEGYEIQRVAESKTLDIFALEGGDIIAHSSAGTRHLSTGIEEPIESLLILEEDPSHFLVGTEGPHIYRVKDGATERLETFDELDCRNDWYTPWGGPPAVRSLARTSDGWIYADIHVGSIMRSPDNGTSWEPVTPDLHEDVHQVATCPKTNDRVYANTAHAVYISEDRGQSWMHRSEGFPYYYGRAIAVHPEDPNCLLASVSKGPGGSVNGQLYRTENAGQTWDHVTTGFPESTRGNIDTFHISFSPDGHAWAVVGKTMYASEDRGKTWKSAWEAPSDIEMIACQK